jgi:uncharacterized membrane protein SpoIIM required for sporulation
VRRRGLASLSTEELRDFPRLYRFASSLFARLETRGDDPATLEKVRGLIGGAHAVLYRDHGEVPASLWRRLWRLYLVDAPRALRAEWRLLCCSLALFYGLALVSYLAVTRRLELAFTLFDPSAVASEIAQLRALAPGESFRGNFTFGLGESPGTAGAIMAHNIGVSLLFFGAALVPPLYVYVLATNGLMLGTYTGVAAHWDQAGSISSILWCHGTLELQAIVLAGLAGLVLVRAIAAPGFWSRTHAMRLESHRALLILAPMVPMLILAGLIEGFISPHAPFAARIAVAVSTGAAFLYWLLFAGRQQSAGA